MRVYGLSAQICTALAILLQSHWAVQGFTTPLRTTRHPSSGAAPTLAFQQSIISANSISRQYVQPLFSTIPTEPSELALPQKTSADSNPQIGEKLLQSLGNNKRKIALSVLAVAACSLGFVKRQELILPLLPYLKGVNQWLRRSLDSLNKAGNAGLGLYGVLFCLWTMTVGVTTPVETAAGFAFGAKRAILVNALGKSLGALVAFFLGRFIFYEFVRKQLQNNEILQLVEESISDHPLLVALMVRLSPLPEPVKNMGMSVLDVKSRYFALSVLLHGFPFTCLWSCMGAETAKVVTLGAVPSTTLKILVSGSTWFGILVSPTLIGWWLNSLRAKRSKRLAENESNLETPVTPN